PPTPASGGQRIALRAIKSTAPLCGFFSFIIERDLNAISNLNLTVLGLARISHQLRYEVGAFEQSSPVKQKSRPIQPRFDNSL
ncbi:hypothetical protein ACFL27_21145, partial [candidate division CSSED10-310 bacterium]